MVGNLNPNIENGGVIWKN